MAEHHDRPSGIPAGASAAAVTLARPSAGGAPESGGADAPGVDALSDVLRAVRLTGALFFRVDAGPPWVIAMPEAARFAPLLRPRAQHVISYHVVTRGSCWAGLPGREPIRLAEGDVCLVPQGDAYAMALAPDLRGGPDCEQVLAFMQAMAAGQLPFTVVEGGTGGERLGLVCGFLGCDAHPFNPLLAALPRLLRVPGRLGPGDPLGRLVEFAVAESEDRRAGAECVRLRLSELMFVEVVRRHLAGLPAEERGWLAGLRDRFVGRALALLHERPGAAWTLEGLARAVGLSRSALAERFAHLVGEPPGQYLTRWRMQVAARLLADGEAKVAAVGAQVGYDSEAAFSRAFKKAAGVSPAAWRSQYARGRAPGSDRPAARPARSPR